MATYRGRPIEYAVHDLKADTYSLVDDKGECVAELKAREFLSIPNRTSLEVRSGRYRPTGSKDQRGADRKSGQPGRGDALDALLYPHLAWPSKPANTAAKAPATSLSLPDIARAIAILGPVPMNSKMLSMLDCETHPPLKREGIVAGEIVGYRCWRIVRSNPNGHGLLRSVYQSDVWKPGEILEGRELGDWDQRGVHAWKDSGSREYHSYIRSYLNRETDPFLFAFNNRDEDKSENRPAMVTGTVFLWGDVVEHERGYRAEYARVRSLDWLYPDEIMMGREQDALDQLRRLYGVAAEPLNNNLTGAAASAAGCCPKP